jgi:outer membrane receptor for ferrienterochelin and colicin
LIGNLSLKDDFTFYFNPDNTLRFGFEINTHYFNPGNLNDEYFEKIVSASSALQTVIYAGYEKKFSDIFSINVSLRGINWNNTGPATIYSFNDNYFVTEAGNLKNFGNTKLTYSPDVVAGGVISIKPSKCVNIQLISKYVGEQFMDNRNIDASKLDAYFVENAFVSFEMKPKNYFKNLRLSLQVNNLFNKKYASNGYMWGDSPYYFPQAGTNYLLGMTLGF